MYLYIYVYISASISIYFDLYRILFGVVPVIPNSYILIIVLHNNLPALYISISKILLMIYETYTI